MEFLGKIILSQEKYHSDLACSYDLGRKSTTDDQGKKKENAKWAWQSIFLSMIKDGKSLLEAVDIADTYLKGPKA